MKCSINKKRVFGGLTLTILAITSLLVPVFGQMPFGAPTTPGAQRNALGAVRSQVGWVENATKVAANYGNVRQNFDAVRHSYNVLKGTMSPKQLAQGANQLAELDAGLDIIQEAFGYYEQDLAMGRADRLALRDLCRVVRETTRLWLQELNKTCKTLQVGWGA